MTLRNLRSIFARTALAAFSFTLLSSVSFADATELDGLWRSPCSAGEMFGQTRMDEHKITGTLDTHTATYYSDAACTTPIIRLDWTVKHLVGNEIRTGVKAIDLTYEKAEATALDVVGEHVLEAWAWCGISSWTQNEKQDLTARTGGDRCIVKLPVSNYTIFSIVDGKLYFGQGFNNDISRRPSDLNTNFFYTKVQEGGDANNGNNNNNGGN